MYETSLFAEEPSTNPATFADKVDPWDGFILDKRKPYNCSKPKQLQKAISHQQIDIIRSEAWRILYPIYLLKHNVRRPFSQQTDKAAWEYPERNRANSQANLLLEWRQDTSTGTMKLSLQTKYIQSPFRYNNSPINLSKRYQSLISGLDHRNRKEIFNYKRFSEKKNCRDLIQIKSKQESASTPDQEFDENKSASYHRDLQIETTKYQKSTTNNVSK